MTSPVVVPNIMETDRGIKSFPFWVIVVNQESDTGQVQPFSSFLGSRHQFPGNSHATVFWENG